MQLGMKIIQGIPVSNITYIDLLNFFFLFLYFFIRIITSIAGKLEFFRLSDSGFLCWRVLQFLLRSATLGDSLSQQLFFFLFRLTGLNLTLQESVDTLFFILGFLRFFRGFGWEGGIGCRLFIKIYQRIFLLYNHNLGMKSATNQILIHVFNAKMFYFFLLLLSPKFGSF